jgi:cysteine desulfurase/selenocysteine lyase
MVGRVDMDGATYAESPRRFEAGTPPIAQAVGLGAALEWMAELPWGAIRFRELELARRLLDGLSGLEGIRVIGPTDLADRQPIVSFDLAGLHPHDICQVLDERGLALRGGHHCAQPLLRAMGVEGATRASIALYNTAEDIEALLAGLHDARRILA